MKFLSAFFFFLFAAAAGVAFIFHSQLKTAHESVATMRINPAILEKKLNTAPPAWMLNQIRSDLKPFSAGITKQMLDAAFTGEQIEKYRLVRFTIKNGHITFARDEKVCERHFNELFTCIKTLNEKIRLPDVDFLVSLEEGFNQNPGISPCFVFAKKKELEGLILIPDIKALIGYAELRKIIPKAADKYPWDRKLSKSFWRGASTGGRLTLTAWDHLIRAKLVLLSLAHPSQIDARFNRIVQSDPEVPILMKAKGMLANTASKPVHLKYKYLVDVDGNSCSYERYFWLLLSNSLVLKQQTPNIQWYYGGLEPYKHYIPIKEDLSDLLQQIEWAKTHDLESRLIAEEATHFVKDNLSSEDISLYFYLLLKEYAMLQK